MNTIDKPLGMYGEEGESHFQYGWLRSELRFLVSREIREQAITFLSKKGSGAVLWRSFEPLGGVRLGLRLPLWRRLLLDETS